MGQLIWLASYPKSGNTWMRAFLHNLFRNPPQPARINELDQFCLGESKPQWYLPYTGGRPTEALTLAEIMALRPRVQQDMTRAFPDSVFVKTHNFLGESNGYPLVNLRVTAGAIYIVRNPLDVTVSAADHFGLSIDDTIAFMARDGAVTGNDSRNVPEVLNGWSTHVRSWTQQPHPGLLVLRYEDMLAKPKAAFAKVCQFLRLPKDNARLDKAVRFSSFKELSGQEAKGGFNERSVNSKSFFRAGKRDQWRTLLTPDQIARIVDLHRDQMNRFGYLPPDARD
ncbi:sulfotransferase domain-containing protein [Oceanibaculum pacificum]|uniref:Sulfotransferase n=1 Tax=Oceanibaculum pacificum TaxID=580166 RepID=A0A154WH54_9PROT|nr:sulfotransferase domain-containing protein [Oceanibaculum pacificum]KZD12842.1 sulfotransferase [Oceanibaculum pacificum]